MEGGTLEPVALLGLKVLDDLGKRDRVAGVNLLGLRLENNVICVIWGKGTGNDLEN